MAKRSRKKEPEEAAKDGNVILFTSLSMILLAFFIVLNSIAVIDQNKKLEAWGSLMGSFGILPGGIRPTEGDVLLPYESPIVKEGESYEDAKMVMEKYLVEYQLMKDVGFSYEGGDMTISISSDFLFPPGKMELNRANLPFLNLITRLVGTVSNDVRVEGYSGRKEIADNRVNAWDLAISRGVTVMQHMIEKGRILPERFSVGGYGAERRLDRKRDVLKRKGGRVDITFVGDVDLRSREDEGLYRYKGFIFDFRKGAKRGS